MPHDHAGAGERRVERRLQRAIADDVSERGQALLFRGERHLPEAARLRNVDPRDRRRGVAHGRHCAPYAQPLEDQARAVRQRERAIAAQRLPGCALVEDDHIGVAGGERQRQRRPDGAGADDDHIVQHGAKAGVTRARAGRPPRAAPRGSSAARGLDVGNRLRRRRRQVLDAGRGDEDVVLDPDADVPECLRHVVGRPDVRAGLDGEDHARRELLRCALHVVQAGIVHVHPQPMAGAVHVELLERAGLQHFVERAPAQAEVDVALRKHAFRDLVVIVKVGARPHRLEAGLLRGEHEFVDGLLRPGEAAVDGEGARDVRGIALDSQPASIRMSSPILQLPVVVAVVQNAGIGSAGDDRRVRDRPRAAAQELVRELGLDLIFMPADARARPWPADGLLRRFRRRGASPRPRARP